MKNKDEFLFQMPFQSHFSFDLRGQSLAESTRMHIPSPVGKNHVSSYIFYRWGGWMVELQYIRHPPEYQR